jgi:hypothetical protein
MRHANFVGVSTAFTESKQTSTADEILQIGTGIAVGPLGDFVQIDILAQRHFRRVNAQNAASPAFVRNGDIDQFVKAAGTQQCRVHQRWPIGCADYDH